MFALGNTAEQVGKSIQPWLNDMKDLRSSMNFELFSLLNKTTSHQSVDLSDCSIPSLCASSLIIIDRNEDLFTCCSHGDNAPLAHRIMSTIVDSSLLKRDSNSNDTSKSIKTCNNKSISVLKPNQDIAMLKNTLQDHSSLWQCTIPSKETSKTISKKSKSQSQLSQLLSTQSKRSPLMCPFSAVSGLPVPLPVSLFSLTATSMSSDSLFSSLFLSILTQPEDQSFSQLTATLKNLIAIENGSEIISPKKKRGYGAEVLALVQLFITCPGNISISESTLDSQATTRESSQRDIAAIKADIDRLGYNPKLCIKYNAILSLCYSVIEAMQRSSSKQLSSVCPWKLSYESRTACEESLAKDLAHSINAKGLLSHSRGSTEGMYMYTG